MNAMTSSSPHLKMISSNRAKSKFYFGFQRFLRDKILSQRFLFLFSWELSLKWTNGLPVRVRIGTNSVRDRLYDEKRSKTPISF